jgi:hypothetical protein
VQAAATAAVVSDGLDELAVALEPLASLELLVSLEPPQLTRNIPAATAERVHPIRREW